MKPNVNGALALKPVGQTWARFFFCQSVGGLVDWGPEIFWGDFLRGDDGDDSSQMLPILLDNIGSKMAFVSVSVWGKVGIFPS